MKRHEQSKPVLNLSATSPQSGMAVGSGHSAAPPAWASRALAGWAVILATGLIVLATVAAFSNSFTGSFLFDDEVSIADNPTIRQLWPIWKPLCPPTGGEPVTGRPLVNLSLAINYAISGYEVWSYHAANLAIHLLAAMLLFGVLRRTFLCR